MSNIDFAQMIIAADKAAEAEVIRARRIKAECRRQILMVLDETAQINLAAAGGGLSAQKLTIYRAGLSWIEEMRRTCARVRADPLAECPAPGNWPEVPATVVPLAAEF